MIKLDCCEINKNRMKQLKINNRIFGLNRFVYVCRSIFIDCNQFNVKQ